MSHNKLEKLGCKVNAYMFIKMMLFCPQYPSQFFVLFSGLGCLTEQRWRITSTLYPSVILLFLLIKNLFFHEEHLKTCWIWCTFYLLTNKLCLCWMNKVAFNRCGWKHKNGLKSLPYLHKKRKIKIVLLFLIYFWICVFFFYYFILHVYICVAFCTSVAKNKLHTRSSHCNDHPKQVEMIFCLVMFQLILLSQRFSNCAILSAYWMNLYIMFLCDSIPRLNKGVQALIRVGKKEML